MILTARPQQAELAEGLAVRITILEIIHTECDGGVDVGDAKH